MFWTQKRLAALVCGFFALAVSVCSLPAWSQMPGPNSPNTPQSQASSLSPQAPSDSVKWNLTDILWGITRLQSSPQKLSAEQAKSVRPVVNKVIEGTMAVRGFEDKVKSILTAEQLAYVEHLAASGELSELPDLPQSPDGQDPLVVYVITALEKKVGR